MNNYFKNLLYNSGVNISITNNNLNVDSLYFKQCNKINVPFFDSSLANGSTFLLRDYNKDGLSNPGNKPNKVKINHLLLQ